MHFYIQHIKHSNVIKIRNRLMLNFFLGLPHTLSHQHEFDYNLYFYSTCYSMHC